jgi:arylsulfatase A-like enzyme
MSRFLPPSLIALTLFAALAQARQPNVILILTDNHGAWTLGSYGNKDIRTPNLDALAQQGTRFTRAYANNPVCSPNRATLLTGLMPSQHGVHCFLVGGPPQTGEGSYCTIKEFPSLPKQLKKQGYACGLVGKWHLGGNEQPQEGFEDYWITKPHGSTATMFDDQIIENGKTRKEPEHATRFWTRHALNFIQQSKDKPFFLYLAYNGPYGLGPAQLKDNDRAPHMKDYATETLPSFERHEPHPWLFNNRDYINNIECIRRYAAEVTTIDDGVGEIMAWLKSLGLDDDTLVVFTGDNGWSGGQQGIWGMGDHTRPLTAFEWTMTVPLIWHWPGKIKAGHTADIMVSHIDFLPSLAALVSPGFASSEIASLPGHSYASVLKGEPIPDWKNEIFYEFENLRCIRTDSMKWIERLGDEPDELYDLATDPREQTNLANDPAHDSKRRSLDEKLDAWFAKTATPEFDLWKNGRSKAPLHYQKPAKPAK